MFLGNINQSNALTLFSLFFGAVGTGFAVIGENQYTIISLIIAAVGYIFAYRFISMFERNDAQIAFGIELDTLSKTVVYGMLPAVLLITVSSASVFSVVVGGLYILAVAVRLAHFNQPVDFQGEELEGTTQGLPLEISALVIPLVCLLGYLVPLSIFQYILIAVYIILGVGYILNYPVPKLPEKWLMYVLGLALLLVILFLFLGSLTA